ncbi:MAG: peptide chain release factor N(5)-glutamine methyltransferase [Lachnospiraceae bacterium]|nr:peptide chain release factor N(5)-glutamine methyltransferase [Lachnospiraceae bacterium]
MKIREMVNAGTETLEKAGVPDAAHDAALLMRFLLGITLTDYLAEKERAISSEERLEYEALIKRRASRGPLQHITGQADFYGYTFKSDARALVPRFDTEIVTEAVLKENPEKDIRVLDLGTGSGCIAVVLKKEGGYREVEASDLDEEALSLARENAALLQAEITFIRSGFFEALHGKYRLIVSNPPYIAEDERDGLEPEVLLFDPEKALFGGSDGLEYYRRIISDAPSYLEDGGKLYLEIGASQAREVVRLLEAEGFSDCHVYRDLAGKDRAVRGVYKRGFPGENTENS